MDLLAIVSENLVCIVLLSINHPIIKFSKNLESNLLKG